MKGSYRELNKRNPREQNMKIRPRHKLHMKARPSCTKSSNINLQYSDGSNSLSNRYINSKIWNLNQNGNYKKIREIAKIKMNN